MNLVEHRSLWSAIQQFPLDDPDAAINFSRKLAAQQSWSPAFTQKAIDEYRKFIFLCCIAPKGASPSKMVDEVWHLHLTYSQSYWIKLCKETLGKDIHHHPSRGGEEEDHRHEQWYADTLQLYETVFESPPPADIWPPPNKDHTPIAIPKKAGRIRNEIKALIFLLLLIPFVINAYRFLHFNPFTLTGPQFLEFFPLLAISSILCFIVVQYEKNRSLIDLIDKQFPRDASIFQLTHFLYGKHRAIQTAIVDLMRRNLVEHAHDHFFYVNEHRYIKTDHEQNPLVEDLLLETTEAVNYDMIACSWYNEKKMVHPILEYWQQAAFEKESLIKRFHYLLIPFVIGMLRIMQGIANVKPVSNLVLQMIIFGVVCLIVEAFFSRRRMLFKKVKQLTSLYHEHKLLHTDNVVNDYALNGRSAIMSFSDGLILAAIFAAYPAVDQARIIDVNELNSRFGGDGGDGGGCSGGGCGGGGCGGCGS